MSVSGTDAVAISGALAVAGFEGAGLASVILAVVPIMDTFSAIAQSTPVYLRWARFTSNGRSPAGVPQTLASPCRRFRKSPDTSQRMAGARVCPIVILGGLEFAMALFLIMYFPRSLCEFK